MHQDFLLKAFNTELKRLGLFPELSAEAGEGEDIIFEDTQECTLISNPYNVLAAMQELSAESEYAWDDVWNIVTDAQNF